MKNRRLKLTAFALASAVLLIAVWKHPEAGAAAVVGAFALIGNILFGVG